MATVITTASRQRVRLFYVGMATALILIVFAGFMPGYFRRLSGATDPLPLFVHVHAAVFTAWMLLLLVQTMLVAADRTTVHRRLGMFAALLVPPMLVLGYETAIFGARHGHAPGGGFPDGLAFLAVTLGDVLLFAGFVAAGLYYRRHPDTHKRLMMLATIGGLLWPAITRIPHVAGNPVAMFGIMAVLLLAGPIYDLLTRGRVHAVNIWGGLLILVSFPIRQAIGMSDAWHDLAAWLTT